MLVHTATIAPRHAVAAHDHKETVADVVVDAAIVAVARRVVHAT